MDEYFIAIAANLFLKQYRVYFYHLFYLLHLIEISAADD